MQRLTLRREPAAICRSAAMTAVGNTSCGCLRRKSPVASERDSRCVCQRWVSSVTERRYNPTENAKIAPTKNSTPMLRTLYARGLAETPSIIFCNSGSIGMRLNMPMSVPPVFPTGTTPTAEPRMPKRMRTVCPRAAMSRLLRSSTLSINQWDVAWGTTKVWPIMWARSR